MSKRRIGLLGGAFNPPHQGHLRLAELSLGHLGLDELRFVPTLIPPHKATAGDGAPRLRLLRAALEGMAACIVEPLELERGGISYTVDTLEALTQREPGNAWIWIMGSDQLEGFKTWKNGARILELASLAVAPRPPLDPHRVLEAQVGRSCEAQAERPYDVWGRPCEAWSGAPGELVWLPGTELELSSSELRTELAAGGLPEGLPIQVRAAIVREKLYR